MNWLQATHFFRPRLLDSLEGYNRQRLVQDIGAGFTVGVVALPLAMAFAIASGLKPEAGLFTAIIAGFLISALGGSRVQIGGPAGAFIVIVYGIVERYGLANQSRFNTAALEDKSEDNRFGVHKLGVESADRAKDRQTQIQVAGIRAASAGGGSGLDSIKGLKLLQDAEARARDSMKSDAIAQLAGMPNATSSIKAQYAQKLAVATRRNVAAMATVHPELLDLYDAMQERMGTGPASQGPAIIRGGVAPPPGAMIRQ